MTPRTLELPGDTSLCLCNCGGTVAKGREFISGHDQRLRGALMRAYCDGTTVVINTNPPRSLTPYEFAAEMDGNGASYKWRDCLSRAESRKREAIAKLLHAAKAETRPHKLGKNLAAGWEVCVVIQLKNGGQEVRYVDRHGKTGKINTPPKEEEPCTTD